VWHDVEDEPDEPDVPAAGRMGLSGHLITWLLDSLVIRDANDQVTGAAKRSH
jgi:hypothetical protein